MHICIYIFRNLSASRFDCAPRVFGIYYIWFRLCDAVWANDVVSRLVRGFNIAFGQFDRDTNRLFAFKSDNNFYLKKIKFYL